MADAILIGIGVLLVVVTVVEVFRDLFQPAEGGALSDWTGRILFRLLRSHPAWLPFAGPLTVVLVIGVWITLLSAGFACFYYVAFPESFRTPDGSVPPASGRVAAAVSVSLESLVTFGFSDLTPRPPLRFLCALEGLLGFGILTASVSSVILLFGALARTRVLALSVEHIVNAEAATGIALADSGTDTTFAALVRDTTYLRVDLTHFPVVYYFKPRRREAAVAYWIGDLLRLAGDGRATHRPLHIRLAAEQLDRALHDFARVAARRMHMPEGQDRAAVFRRLAEQHLIEPRTPFS